MGMHVTIQELIGLLIELIIVHLLYVLYSKGDMA